MTGLSWLGWAHLVLLLALLPALAAVGPPSDLALPPRRSIYGSASAVLWGLAALTVFVLAWEGIAPHEIGLSDGRLSTTAAWGSGTAAVALLAAVGVTLGGRRVGLRESVWVAYLMPRSWGDRRAFVGVALTAGITEELIYRGYALWALSGWLGDRPWVAAAVVALAFGMLHAYQNLIGILRATALGFLMAVPVIAGGTLWAAIAAHAAVDLALGLLGKTILREEAVDAALAGDAGGEPTP